MTADAGSAYAKVYGGLERRGIDPLIPAKKEPIKSRAPTHRFRYHARRDIVKCPRGKVLRSGRAVKYGCFFHFRTRDCARCTLKGECLSKGRVNKAVVIGDDYPVLVRARSLAPALLRGPFAVPGEDLAVGLRLEPLNHVAVVIEARAE